MDSKKDVAALVGRVLLALLFVWAGYGKITDYAGTADFMASAGVPMIGVLLPLSLVVELGGALALIIGWKTRWAALALVAFSVVATLTFHNFWAMKPEAVMMNALLFYKNVAVIGGLLMVWAFGPGRLSVDRA